MLVSSRRLRRSESAADALTDTTMHGVLTPEQSESLRVASEKIVSDANAADAVTGTGATSPSDKASAPPAGGVVSNGKTAPDKAQAPEAVDPLDLSFLPDDVRSKVHVDDDVTAAALKSGWMAHGDATRKYQEASKLREQAEALKRSAANYDFLMSDEARAAKVVAIMADKGETPPVDDADALEPYDADSILSTIKREVSKGKAEVRDELRKEVEAPKVWADSMNAALGVYAEKHAVDVETMTTAINLAEAEMRAGGFRYEPEEVPRLMGAFVLAAKAAKPAAVVMPPVNNPVTGNGHAGLVAVASPTARGGPHTAGVVPFPAHWRNGECPLYETDDQLTESNLYRNRVRFGPQVTREDVRAGAAGR